VTVNANLLAKVTPEMLTEQLGQGKKAPAATKQDGQA
jgi:hypothetical protein